MECYSIQPNKFILNFGFFIESLTNNNCLFKKVAISESGDVKNCLNFNNVFGNVANDQIKLVIQKPEFVKLWGIKKDKIRICNKCEFRYMCLDCRAYRSNYEDLYSKPKYCSYSPKTMKWNY